MSQEEPPVLPSDVDGHVQAFDKFAEWASTGASRALFFAWCVTIVLLWLTEGLIDALAGKGFGYFLDDKYQLQINTTTTILTFLMVALLQNSQTRKDNATQHKLNAIAEGVARVLDNQPDDGAREARELRLAVGLEQRESA